MNDVKFKPVTLEDIQKARENIKGTAILTPLKKSNYFSQAFHKNIFLKMENLQNTGAFKIRGARNKLLSLTDAEKKRGVITASAGNHAQGVAYQATLLGISSTVVMSTTTPMAKVLATKSYGAQVVLKGNNYDEAYQEALRIQKEKGLTFVHGYEDPYIVAGQGTIGLEILEQCPQIEAVVVPIGGGGLISGISTAIKSLKPNVKIIGVQAAGAASMAESLHKGHPMTLKNTYTMAEGIFVNQTSPYTFSMIQKYVDQVLTVTDEEIAAAILQLLEKSKILVEGAGATTLATLLTGKLLIPEKNICFVLSGGNLDVTTLAHVIERGMVTEGRLLKLSVTLDDKPGSLHQLTKVVAELQANIMQVSHDRATAGVQFGKTKVDVTLETKGSSHIEEILASLQKAGYAVRKLS